MLELARGGKLLVEGEEFVDPVEDSLAPNEKGALHHADVITLRRHGTFGQKGEVGLLRVCW